MEIALTFSDNEGHCSVILHNTMIIKGKGHVDCRVFIQFEASLTTLQLLPAESLEMAPLLQIELSIIACTRMHCKFTFSSHLG